MTFYRHEDCEGCQAIEEVLGELAVSCIVVSIVEKPPHDDLLPNAPTLMGEGKVIEGEKPIFDYLDTLRECRQQWYKYQSDACYCDE